MLRTDDRGFTTSLEAFVDLYKLHLKELHCCCQTYLPWGHYMDVVCLRSSSILLKGLFEVSNGKNKTAKASQLPGEIKIILGGRDTSWINLGATLKKHLPSP